MYDEDRKDSMIANCWAAMYREHDDAGNATVDYSQGMELIHNAASYPAIMPLVLSWLQKTDDRIETANRIAEVLADIVRAEYRTQVENALDREKIKEDLMRWEYQESEQLAKFRK